MKEVETIDGIIAGESEEKESLLRDLKDNLTETMKIIVKLNEEILVLLEKQKDIEQEIADANNFRKDVRKGIQKIDGFLRTRVEVLASKIPIRRKSKIFKRRRRRAHAP